LAHGGVSGGEPEPRFFLWGKMKKESTNDTNVHEWLRQLAIREPSCHSWTLSSFFDFFDFAVKLKLEINEGISASIRESRDASCGDKEKHQLPEFFQIEYRIKSADKTRRLQRVIFLF
jgi:hypothetical protein